MEQSLKQIAICNGDTDTIIDTSYPTLGELKKGLKLTNSPLFNKNTTFKDVFTEKKITSDSYRLPDSPKRDIKMADLTESSTPKKSERPELYSKIKNLISVTPSIKQKIGNYTNLSTLKLKELVSEYTTVQEIKQEVKKVEPGIEYLSITQIIRELIKSACFQLNNETYQLLTKSLDKIEGK